MKIKQALASIETTSRLTGEARKPKKYKLYSYELSQEQFKLIEEFLPKVKLTRPPKYTKLELINGMLYVLKTGCQWRELSTKYPHWNSVYKYFAFLSNHFVLPKLINILNKKLTKKLDKTKSSVKYPDFMLIIDSKSIRCGEYYLSSFKGRDGHKKIKGIKLCPVIDRLRRVWNIGIFGANTSELRCYRIGLERTLMVKNSPLAKVVIADRYFDSKDFKEYCKRVFNLDLYTLRRGKKTKVTTLEEEARNRYLDQKMKGIVNPFRYIVEQFFSHIEKSRRLVMVYERKSKNYETFVNLRVMQLLIRRLC
jgi:putative transposase